MKNPGIRLRTAYLLSSALVLASCATTPAPPIDVSRSAVLVKSTLADSSKPTVSAFEVQNQAPPPPRSKISAFDDVDIPIRSETDKTVADDLTNYFAKATRTDPASPQKVIARIERADAHFVFGGAKRIPFLGILAIGSDTDFVMNLRVIFEVETNGKVLRTYQVNETYTVPDGKSADTDSVNDSYRRLVELYRTRLFSELDQTFTPRYLQ
jgi:hypothetical protein